jgi:hypothetical protein
MFLNLRRSEQKQFAGVTPVKSALFSEDWVGFGIARMYESLMKETLIDARAFRDRATAAAWLRVPAEILKLEDKSGASPLGVTGLLVNWNDHAWRPVSVYRGRRRRALRQG